MTNEEIADYLLNLDVDPNFDINFQKERKNKKTQDTLSTKNNLTNSNSNSSIEILPINSNIKVGSIKNDIEIPQTYNHYDRLTYKPIIISETTSTRNSPTFFESYMPTYYNANNANNDSNDSIALWKKEYEQELRDIENVPTNLKYKYDPNIKGANYVSDDFLNHLIDKEEFRQDWYDDGYGNQTIAFGFTGDIAQKFAQTDRSLDSAIKIYENDILQPNVNKLNNLLKQNNIVLDNYDYDSMVDLIYNGGMKAAIDFIPKLKQWTEGKISKEKLQVYYNNHYVTAKNKNTNTQEYSKGLKYHRRKSRKWVGR
ncbi:MAG: hypothetical protein LBM05_00655 [Endomicrobium sp.]|jgi:GH24 family phage-related lysozyme (muramidase)|nr:hypothetical protein [Endomicrobium sp.]